MVVPVQLFVKNLFYDFENKEKEAFTVCDLTKAFNCIPCDISISKLEYY